MTNSRSSKAASERQQRVRITGPEALRLHAALLVALALCVSAFTFEITRALGGHRLSWLYVVEWPLFAAFGIYMWWSLLHADGEPLAPTGSASSVTHVPDPALAAWNKYVQELEGTNPGADGESGDA